MTKVLPLVHELPWCSKHTLYTVAPSLSMLLGSGEPCAKTLRKRKRAFSFCLHGGTFWARGSLSGLVGSVLRRVFFPGLLLAQPNA